MSSMGESRLGGSELVILREADLTYAEVGRTLGVLPSGYHHLHRSVVVGVGSARFEEASRTLLGWDMHRRAGVAVRPSSESVIDGAVAVLRLGRGALGVNAPVRVVYSVDEPRRRGFAYGTLPGHPERGEEAFVLELHDDGEVTLTISAFSRPASVLARAVGPAGRAVQGWMTSRYLRAV